MDNLAADFIISNNSPIESEYTINEGENFDCSFKIYASGTVWGSITGNIESQTDLKEALDEKANVSAVEIIAENVTQNTSDITDINNTLNSFGDIVTYDAADFATKNQGELANSALQPDDDISELVNDVGYITMSALGDYATLQALENGLATKQDTISDLSDIRSNAENGQSAYTTIQSYGDIVTYNADNFATSIQGGLADTALQPNDDITELNNNAGYITSASLPTVNNNKVTIQKNSIDVGSFTLNQSTDKTINLSIPTQASDINAVPTSRKVNNKALSSDITLSASDVSALPSSTTINDLTTSTQQDALNSGATSTNIGQIATNTSDITDIEGLIPVQATTINQLADKSFVNSSIATNTAYFIGTFNSVADLEAYSGTLTNNDYAFVETTDSAGNTLYDRYKYTTATTPASWQFEYELNNSSFTSNQWASINSGITANDVTLIGTAIQPNDNVSSLTNDAGYITSSSLPTVNNGTLTIQQNGTDVQTFTANQSTNATANITVPTDTNDLTNGAGYITGIDSTDISNALGYTPANASKVIDYYGTCDTSANTQEKAVTCSDFVLATGASIRVKFTNNQSYNGAPTLNVNNTGAYTVQSMSGTDALRYCWRAGEVVAFTFDGSNWLMEDGALATVTYYGYTRLTSSATSVSTTTALTPWSLSMLVQNMIEPYPIYSVNSTYAVGDKVRYDMNAWECNTPITEPEAWTEAHWTKLYDIQTQLDSKGTVNSVNNVGPDANGNVSLSIPTVDSSPSTTSTNPLQNKMVIDYVTSRDENLISNGFATLGTNYNFSSFTFDGSDTYGAAGCFTKEVSSSTQITTDEFMPIDITKTYKASFSVKNEHSTSTQVYTYLYANMFDIDKNSITYAFCHFIENTTTTLAQDLKNGDTVVYLTDLTNWNTTTSQSYQKGFIFWNYTNSFGYTYPVETYSRNVFDALYTDNSAVNKTNNTITLNSAWNKGTIPAGTSLSQCTRGGSTYVYLWQGNIDSNVWTPIIGTLTPDMVRSGTAYVKLGWIADHNNVSDVKFKISSVSFSAKADYNDLPTKISDLTDDTSTNPIDKADYATSAGSATSATTASKLGSTDVGSATKGIYLDDGVATACTYSVAKDVPSNAVFTDTTYSNFTGADSITGGASGLVPAPSAGDEGKYLKGDGTWGTVSSGSSTDVQINGTSITSGGVANIVTNTAYNASSNKIATMSDLPSGGANTDLSNLTATGEAHFLKNRSTGVSSIAIGNGNSASGAINIGDLSTCGEYSIAIGGYNNGYCSIMLGNGYSSNVNYSFDVGVNDYNSYDRIGQVTYQMLDLKTGLIPDARISKQTSITSSSTDAQIPSAKSVIELLKTIYPVGSVYLSTNSTCPMASLFGTWTLVNSGKALWTGTGSNGNTTIAAGLPNISGTFGDNSSSQKGCINSSNRSGAFTNDTASKKGFANGSANETATTKMYFNASNSNSIYSANVTTVQPPAYVVNVWRRTA